MSLLDTFRPRNSPYVWVTWITGLLAGTESCAWKAWVKSHYTVPRQDSNGNMDQWIKDHDAMTARRVFNLKQEGYDVTVEDENSFTLRGQVAALAGKPDIIATRHETKTGLIIDEKSGREKEKYIWQVLIYMFAKRLTNPSYTYQGEIEYQTKSVPIDAEQLGATNTNRIAAIMKLVGGAEEPKRVPSKLECGYCDIVGCPDRYENREVDVRTHF